MKLFCALILIIFGFQALTITNAANQNQPETLNAGLPPLEISPPDTVNIDTLASQSDADLDTIITYSAEHIRFTFEPRVTFLQGEAKVRYRNTALDAEIIRIYWDTHLLEAEGGLDTFRVVVPWTVSELDSLTSLIDSSPLDSSQIEGSLADSSAIDSLIIARPTSTIPPLKRDSIAMVGYPRLDDGIQIINGEQLSYDMKTRRGRVLEGVTETPDGHYYGKKIKKVDENVYNIRSGYFTSCEYEVPHYLFWSRDMKLTMKDKVVSRPVVLYFDRTPVLIFPFGIFSTEGGRHSGLIIPKYGESASQGRYFTNLGYYWAPNDYFDGRGSIDYYERSGLLFHGNLGYTKRYRFNGGISGSMTNRHFSDSIDRSWDVKLRHNHTLSPTMSLHADGYYVSDGNYIRNVSQNQLARLNRIIRSTATLNKRWDNTPYSSTVNLRYEKNLDNGSIVQSFPRVNLSRNRSKIFPASEDLDLDDEKWWNKIYYGYTGSAEIKKNVRVTTDSISTIVDDSLITIAIENQISRSRGGVKHNLNFTFALDPIYYIGITPSLNYSEVWVDEWNEYFLREDGVIDTIKHDGKFRARRTFSTSIGLSTKLYGLFSPQLFALEAIRHTFSPTISLTYAPDFSEAKWGYYDLFSNNSGRKIFRDQFAGNIYGATPKTESRSIGFGVANLFEYKLNRDGAESKGQLFTMSSRTSYNFAADSLKWANLSSTLRIPALKGGKGRGFFSQVSGDNLTFSALHSFYALDANNITVVNKPAPNGLRMLSYDLSTSFSVAKKSIGSDADSVSNVSRQSGNRFEHAEWQPSNLPWKAGFTFRYSENHTNPADIIRNIRSSAKLDLSVTRNWKVSYSTTLDLHRRKVVTANVSLYRDLHCWEGKFIWNPIGLGKGYYLVINIKSSQLKDVKIEKREGGGGFRGF